MSFVKAKDEVLAAMQVDPHRGLEEEEADRRLAQYGENRLAEKSKKSIWRMLARQLKDALIYVLLAAAAITCFIGEYADAGIIFAVIGLNAAIGVLQEYKADKAIAALRQLAVPLAVVRRGGLVREVRSESLVPGDLVILESGCWIPADLRLLESVNLQIEEAALTGESVPVTKDAEAVLTGEEIVLGDRVNMAFMSTLVTYGRGEGIVVATGLATEIGKIAKVLDEDLERMTPLQLRLAELARWLSALAAAVCGVVFVVGFFQGRNLFAMFLTAISLAVAAIPESLPAIVTIVLAAGVTRMARVNAIVKQMTAVETLGSVNIICTDKTGTLTQNKMTAVNVYTLGKARMLPSEADRWSVTEQELLRSMVLCSDADISEAGATGDPTEIALLSLGRTAGLEKTALLAQAPRVAENPFDSERKRMSTQHRQPDGYRIYCKGAIDSLLLVCSKALVDGSVVALTEERRQAYLAAAEAMSDQALRVLAAATKSSADPLCPEAFETELIFLGIIGMMDPPRPEVAAAIEKAHQAGIRTIMITGDHRNTAVAIARELGLAQQLDQCLTGSEVDRLTDAQLAAMISHYRIFARVSAEHKVRIVRALKAAGNVVSMTGDGVNDAPALKYADVGVAMGMTGTDVAKGACDIILADDNFATIVRAVEEGRNIYGNIKKAVLFLLACNLGEVLAIFLAILFYWPVPLLPTQILWVNLLTDSLPAIALGMEAADEDSMQRGPRPPAESIFAKGAAGQAILAAAMTAAATLAAFFHSLAASESSLGAVPDEVLAYARTMAFVTLASAQLFYAFALRRRSGSCFYRRWLSNKYLDVALLLGIMLEGLVIGFPPLAAAFKMKMLLPADWIFAVLLSLLPMLSTEAVKFFRRHSRYGQ